MGIPGLPSGFVFLIIFLIILAASAIKILREYERGVIFRLGRLIGAKGPGLILVIPFIDGLVKSPKVLITVIPAEAGIQ